MENNRYYIELVEKFFTSVGADPNEYVVDEDENVKSWRIFRGSSISFIHLNFTEKILRIASPIIFLPQNNILALYRECLEINFTLPNCTIYAKDEVIGIAHYRPLEGLDYEEFSATVDILSGVSDDLDDIFKEKYGAIRYTDEM